MDIAFVGTGYVADFYAATLPNHPQLRLAGVFDQDSERAQRFSRHHDVPVYADLATLLDDPAARIVVNLTNPRKHYEVSRQCLLAGKHVYSEKPLGMTLTEAQQLADLASERGLRLAGAPCNAMSDAFAVMKRMIGEGAIGQCRLAYAEMDDGMVHRLRYRKWANELGVPWPAGDEFEVGCTFEHAGYQLVLLAALFGPVRHVTSFASCQVPIKAPDLQTGSSGPDLSIGVLQYDGNMVARLTCSVLAPERRSLTVIGEEGWLILSEVWDYHSSLRYGRWSRPLVARAASRFLRWPHDRGVNVPRGPRRSWSKGHRMDFSRGIAEFSDAIGTGRRSLVEGDIAVHVSEVTDMLQRGTPIAPEPVRSTFPL